MEHIPILVLDFLAEVFPAVPENLILMKGIVMALNPGMLWESTYDVFGEGIAIGTDVIPNEVVRGARASLITAFGRFVGDTLVVGIVPFGIDTLRYHLHHRVEGGGDQSVFFTGDVLGGKSAVVATGLRRIICDYLLQRLFVKAFGTDVLIPNGPPATLLFLHEPIFFTAHL